MSRGRFLIVALVCLWLAVPVWCVHDALTRCPHVVNLGPPVHPIVFVATSEASTTTIPEVTNGHLALTGTFSGRAAVPVGTIVDLTLAANGAYLEPPRTSAPSVLSIVREDGDGKGGWTVSLRAESVGDSTVTASHHHGRCPGPVGYADYAFVVQVTPE